MKLHSSATDHIIYETQMISILHRKGHEGLTHGEVGHATARALHPLERGHCRLVLLDVRFLGTLLGLFCGL